jgi:hypothetical protein
MIEEEAMLYLGYCTMLELAEMHRLCPGSKPLGVYQMEGYRLRFSAFHDALDQGSCDLEVAPGHRMWGLLYDMVDAEYDALDLMAGVDKGYLSRINITVTNDAGESRAATTYRSPNPGGPFSPTAAYTRPILAGARELGLAADYIGELEGIVAAAR